MATYLVNRRDMPEIVEDDPIMLARTVFFQMWQNRFSPYTALAEGDLVFIGDPDSRRVLWAARVDRLLSDFHYDGRPQALRALRKAYGLYLEDLNDYHHDRPETGWLLAWSPRVLARLDRELQAGVKFGRNGYRALSDTEAATICDPGSLPDTAMAGPPAWYDPSRARQRRAPEVSRYVPKHVVEQVKQRDGNRCTVCGTLEGLHLDHITPHAHGGPSTADNLRLLCAYSNLSKGAGHPDAAVRCEVWRRVVDRAGEEFLLEDGQPFTYNVEGGAVRLAPGMSPVSRAAVLAASRAVGSGGGLPQLDAAVSRRLSALLADPRIAVDPSRRERSGSAARRQVFGRWRRIGWFGRDQRHRSTLR